MSLRLPRGVFQRLSFLRSSAFLGACILASSAMAFPEACLNGLATNGRVRFQSQMSQAAQALRLPEGWVNLPPNNNHGLGFGVPEQIRGFHTAHIEQVNSDFQTINAEAIPSLGREYSVGILFDLNTTGPDGRMQEVNRGHRTEPVFIERPVPMPTLPMADIEGERLSIGGETYRLVNVGSRGMLSRYSSIASRIEEVAHGDHPHVFLPISRTGDTVWQKLHELQDATSYLTMQNYKRWKPYLSDTDLNRLRDTDYMIGANNDYLVLMRDFEGSVGQLSFQQYSELALGALRMARSGYQWDLMGFWNFRNPGNLPLLSRVRGEDKTRVQNFIRSLENQGKNVAEITRFSRFQEMPRELTKLLALRQFEHAFDSHEPIDVFMMTVDQDTRRIFAEFQMHVLAEIPLDVAEYADEGATDGHHEFIMYIDTHTPEFANAIAHLRGLTRNITSSSIPRINSASRPTRNWSNWHVPRASAFWVDSAGARHGLPAQGE